MFISWSFLVWIFILIISCQPSHLTVRRTVPAAGGCLFCSGQNQLEIFWFLLPGPRVTSRCSHDPSMFSSYPLQIFSVFHVTPTFLLQKRLLQSSRPYMDKSTRGRDLAVARSNSFLLFDLLPVGDVSLDGQRSGDSRGQPHTCSTQHDSAG